jgi:hypothetical protein
MSLRSNVELVNLECRIHILISQTPHSLFTILNSPFKRSAKAAYADASLGRALFINPLSTPTQCSQPPHTKKQIPSSQGPYGHGYRATKNWRGTSQAMQTDWLHCVRRRAGISSARIRCFAVPTASIWSRAAHLEKKYAAVGVEFMWMVRMFIITI